MLHFDAQKNKGSGQGAVSFYDNGGLFVLLDLKVRYRILAGLYCPNGNLPILKQFADRSH